MTQTTDKTRAGHTPGRWGVYHDASTHTNYVGVYENDEVVGICRAVSPANAHLIALAPEMAEMLRVLVGTLGHREAYEVESGRWDDEDSATMEQARHLLARLDGDV